MKLRILLNTFLTAVLFVLLAAPSIVLAQAAPVTIQPEFGKPNTYGIGPRAIGMGGAFTAIADDASASYWNPAGLSQVNSYELSISSAPLYFQNNINPTVSNQNFPNSFGAPWYASIQLIIPVAKDNTLALSFFRPFHPQLNYADSSYSAIQQVNGSYFKNPSFQESEIVLSYAARFAGVNNFSVGLNVKRITNDPYYIEYFPQNDAGLQQGLNNSGIGLLGFGVDLGVLYRIPITKYSEEFRIGLSLRDLVSDIRYTSDLVASPSNTVNEPYAYSVSNGYQTHIPPEITLGLAYKNDYLFKVRNITALDLDQISDPRYDGSNNKILRFGTEFWFFNDVVGVRGGYSSPLDNPGTISLGLSVRPLNGDFEADVAFLQEVDPSATQASGTQIATIGGNTIDFENFYLGLTYGFGGGNELPPPKVSAFVRPSTFTPSLGEKATFYLDTSEDVSLNHWTVLIYDQNNKLVRGLRGVGAPPSKIVWSGETDQYEPLPPGVYNWAFQVWDQLDHIGSTPVQTVEILGPEGPRDPAKLLSMRQQQATLLAQERQQLTTLAQQNLNKLLGIEPTKTPTKTAADTTAPVEAMGNTAVPDAGTVPIMGFNNLSPEQVLTAHFDKNQAGDSTIVVSYRSGLSYVPYLYNEAAEVIKTTVKSVGTGMKEINTHVYYGKNELALITPSMAAANYAAGRIDEKTLLQLSDVRVNGTKVGPNGN